MATFGFISVGMGLANAHGGAGGGLSLASISPNYGSTGATRSAVITKSSGPSFTGSETVTVNGSACSVTAHTATTLTVTIPAGVTRGIGNVVVNSATLTSGYFALAMTGWVDPNAGVTSAAGLISAITDKAGTTSVFTSNWIAPVGARPTLNATEFGSGTRAGVDFLIGAVQSGLDGGAKLPFGSGVGATKGSLLWIGQWSGSSQPYGPLATNESNDWNLVNNISSGDLLFAGGNTFAAAAISPTVQADGVLRSYMGVYDATLGSANVKLVINGSTVATANNTSAFTSNGAHVCIGTYFSTLGAIEPGNSLAGSMAECLFEAAAWSSAEIAFLTSKTTVGSPANLAGVP